MTQYRLGISMAGAISAGAYSAGAFDLLTEALDLWAAAKNAGQDVPQHDVVITVLSGASAGAITAALGMVALSDTPAGAAPQTMPVPPGVGPVFSTLPRLYQAWVSGPRFIGTTAKPGLLGCDDLHQNSGTGAVMSLLDVSVLNRIADTAFDRATFRGPPRPYLSQTLDLFFTHSNLRGVPYDIRFDGAAPGTGAYRMLWHGDRVHYRLTGLGCATTLSGPWAQADTPEPDPLPPHRTRRTLSVTSLADPAAAADWKAYATAALASAAFPVGLAARAVLGVTADDYRTRQWPINRPNGTPHTITPAATLPDRADYPSVDGGVINNEPFDLARWSLQETPGQPNERSAVSNDRAVLMIDPFPEPPGLDFSGLDVTLAAVLKGLLPMLISQARFKLEELVDVLDDTVYSRYMIGPVRYDATGKPAPNPIACGLLGGFGGFLHEAFRAHDYQLGRHNAYRFLKNHLTVPLGNIVVGAGYAGLDETPWRNHDGTEVQIIPLTGRLANLHTEDDLRRAGVAAPTQWPQVTEDDLAAFTDAAIVRAKAVYDRLTGGGGLWKSIGLWLIWTLGVKKRLRNALYWIVKRDLIRRDQLNWTSVRLSQEDRLVLAALASPSEDPQSLDDLASASGLPADTVTTLLPALRKAGLIVAVGPGWRLAGRGAPPLPLPREGRNRPLADPAQTQRNPSPAKIREDQAVAAPQ